MSRLPSRPSLAIPFSSPHFPRVSRATNTETPTPRLLPARIEPGRRLALSRCEKGGLEEPAVGTVGPEHKVLGDNEVKLQSCSVETVEKFVKQRAKPM